MVNVRLRFKIKEQSSLGIIYHSPLTIHHFSKASLQSDVMNIPLQILKQFLRPFWSSVGDEDLAKVFFGHHLDQTLDAAVIEFVEDVVEE